MIHKRIVIGVMLLSMVQLEAQVFRLKMVASALGRNCLVLGKKYGTTLLKNTSIQVKEKPFEVAAGGVMGGFIGYQFSGNEDSVFLKGRKIITGAGIGVVIMLHRGSILNQLKRISAQIEELRIEQHKSFDAVKNHTSAHFKVTNTKIDMLSSKIELLQKDLAHVKDTLEAFPELENHLKNLTEHSVDVKEKLNHIQKALEQVTIFQQKNDKSLSALYKKYMG